MNLEIGKKALITTSDWFMAPNGQHCKAVFGTIKAIRSSEDTLRIKTNSRSTNWYVEIGNMTIAGCQIHYGIAIDECNTDVVQAQSVNNGVVSVYYKQSEIYNADNYL